MKKARRERERPQQPVGRLDDGTPIYAPIGEMVHDGDRVLCHLCGRWLRMVAGSHLIARHGMTASEYRGLLHLDTNTSTACQETSEIKRVGMLEQIADAGPGRVYPLEPRGGRPTVPRWRSLAVRRPDLIVEWDSDSDSDANPDPNTIGEHSHTKVAWRCRECGHRWKQSPKARSSGLGCPACGRARTVQATIQRNQQPPTRERSLGALRPDLLNEWHPVHNQGVDPFAVARGSERKVWWQCASCAMDWQAAINDRTRAGRPSGCPKCSLARRAADLTVVARTRSFPACYPHLLTEWHPTRNGDLDPFTVASSSVRKLWWRCRYCAAEWKTSPAARRHSPGGCPACAQSRGQRRRRAQNNDAATRRPDRSAAEKERSKSQRSSPQTRRT